MKENLHTKYTPFTPFTYNDVALNEKPLIMKENLSMFFFIIHEAECIASHTIRHVLHVEPHNYSQ